MKRVLFFALLMGFATLQAQNSDEDKRTISKGTWNLGGNVGFGFNSSEDAYTFADQERKSSSIAVFPNIGYTMAEDWMVGLRTGYGFSKNQTDRVDSGDIATGSESRSESFTVAPYVRRYFGLTRSLLVNLQGEIGYGHTWTESTSSDTNRSSTKGNQYFVAVRPGLSFFVSDKLALEAFIGALNYSSSKVDFSSGETTQTNYFRFDLDSSNILFGLSYYF
ncbi:MAG: autotransporter outer membrane beta-barrel domain-containing protein [Flavobacteriaceae bacterium]|nr:autotransporter outer membrane beta-barrel domain-containing protein [Flavobacteriaceae bacterium]